MRRQLILSTAGFVASALIMVPSVGMANDLDDKVAEQTCAKNWQPTSFPEGATLVYKLRDDDTKNYYTVNLIKETEDTKGRLRQLVYNFYINYESNSESVKLVSTMRRNVTEFIFDTKVFSAQHKHMKVIKHEKLKRTVSSETFRNIRQMLPSEKIMIIATQRANKSKKVGYKKWIESPNNFDVDFLGCSSKLYGSETYNTRTYVLNYKALNFSGNAHNTNRPQHRKLTLDEKTGIMLEMVVLNKGGLKTSAAYLSRITQ